MTFPRYNKVTLQRVTFAASVPEKAVMVRIRFRVVFILLVLILLIASAIFGLLTYWLDREPPPVSGSKWGSEIILCRVSRLGGKPQKGLVPGAWVK